MPARLSRIIRAAARFGVEIVKPNGGSHWKAKKDGCRTYPVAAHNGKKTEISDLIIKKLCEHFEIDPEDFDNEL